MELDSLTGLWCAGVSKRCRNGPTWTLGLVMSSILRFEKEELSRHRIDNHTLPLLNLLLLRFFVGSSKSRTADGYIKALPRLFGVLKSSDLILDPRWR